MAEVKTYSNKSNARRAAVKAGLDPNTSVFAKAGAYIVKEPEPKPARTVESKPAKAPRGEARPRSNKTDLLLSMLAGDGAALTKATEWLPHTLRARIAGLGKGGFKVARDRKDGVTTYRIAS